MEFTITMHLPNNIMLITTTCTYAQSILKFLIFLHQPTLHRILRAQRVENGHISTLLNLVKWIVVSTFLQPRRPRFHNTSAPTAATSSTSTTTIFLSSSICTVTFESPFFLSSSVAYWPAYSPINIKHLPPS